MKRILSTQKDAAPNLGRFNRLTFDGHIIETGTTSYRLAHTRAARKGSNS
jgi:hypothetical protein